MTNTLEIPAITSEKFREVLGHYPTGVAVITAVAADGENIAMVVGTFTSVSLDPPLIAFLPTKSSYTYQRLRTAGRFAVNILAQDQEDLCRKLARPSGDKLVGVAWSTSAHGAPVLADVVASIDCTFHAELDGGDHYIVLGAVQDLTVHRSVVPLLFFQGGYGGFTPRSLLVRSDTELASAVALAHEARADLEVLAEGLSAEVTAYARVGDEVAAVATAIGDDLSSQTVLGSRFPLMPPLGELFVAWDEVEIERWLHRAAGADETTKQFLRERLARTREAGWAFTLADTVDDNRLDPVVDAVQLYNEPTPTPARVREVHQRLKDAAGRYQHVELVETGTYDIGSIVAPVLNAQGEVQLVLRVTQLRKGLQGAEVLLVVRELTRAATAATARVAAKS